MRRVAIVIAITSLGVLGFVVLLAGAPPADLTDGTAALIADVRRTDPAAPLVGWVGDSTMLSIGQLSYPDLVRGAALAPAKVESVVRAGPGFTFYDFYCVIGALASSHPAVVVLGLNLRRMREQPPVSPQLCSRLPVAAVWEAASLPFADVGLSFTRILYAQVLRWSPARWTAWAWGTTRTKAAGAWLGLWLSPSAVQTPGVGPRTPAGPRPEQDFVQQWRRNAVERPATSRMLSATVRRGRRGGARVLVVVSPAPMALLTERDAWDAPAWERLIARYRDVVEDAGGTLLDFHDVVSPDGFRAGGIFNPIDSHLNSLGAVQLAAKLVPHVTAALHLPAAADGTGTR